MHSDLTGPTRIEASAYENKKRTPKDSILNLLIRRLCYAHPLPAHSTADLPKRYSLVRSRRQR